MTLQAIADALNRERIKTKTGRRWAPETVRYVLANDLYRPYVKRAGVMPRLTARVLLIVIVLLLVFGLRHIAAGAGQQVANLASYIGGVFALIMMYLYLKPRAVCTVEFYEHIPGASPNRTFRLLVRNPGNVPVRIVRFTAHFQGDAEPPGYTDYARLFEGRVLEPSAEVPVWLNDAEMRRRTGFTVVYRGWLPMNFEARCRAGPYGVTFVETVSLAGEATMSARGMVAGPPARNANEPEEGKEDFGGER
jgi:hypothetical protein